MGIRMNLKEAAKTIGLTETALRTGIKQGKYPYIRVGRGRGRLFVDVDLLEETLKREALQNAEQSKHLYNEYQKEHNTEVVYMCDILSKCRD